jgi:hypothetical protein
VVSDDGVACERPGGMREYVSWSEVDEIAIVTEKLDLVANDVWLLVGGRARGCAIPQGAEGEKELLFDELPKRFRPFNYDAIIQAMSSVERARFIIWKEPS